MTTHNGIECPCYGTLEELHAALIKDLNWKGNQITINGWGFTVTEIGFRSNESEREYETEHLTDFLHTGTAILLRLIETGFEKNYNGDFVDHFEIVTTGKIPHISKRCALCGMQLNQDEQEYGACSSCHAEEVN